MRRRDVAGARNNGREYADGMAERSATAAVAKRIAHVVMMRSSLATGGKKRTCPAAEATLASRSGRGCRWDPHFQIVDQAVAVQADEQHAEVENHGGRGERA